MTTISSNLKNLWWFSTVLTLIIAPLLVSIYDGRKGWAYIVLIGYVSIIIKTCFNRIAYEIQLNELTLTASIMRGPFRIDTETYPISELRIWHRLDSVSDGGTVDKRLDISNDQGTLLFYLTTSLGAWDEDKILVVKQHIMESTKPAVTRKED
ncbi:hypothetical protein QWY85_10165 [Neolewinella lacunae]|uniref:Uncharacterized protein n=1 Tax=Neolewinella lacunae TaxID=1517758 RepID=A0A923PL22_9BACT|nr:hypothetical protein [Neolewinella lacunae]MBC6993168.1 hypothetical protein [Neolewinella lacunae]MDN3635025.1 hypothetical protein [Neolewinella lacunae]